MKRALRIIGRLIWADFLERTRRYSFIITMGMMLFVGYASVPPLESNALTVDLGNLRGIYNSAWIGSMIALISSIVLSLPGFYLIKNAVSRDWDTGVGQIIATTPLSKGAYLLGKLLSNFIFLLTIMVPVVLAAAGMQLIRGDALQSSIVDLVAPFVFAAVPTLLIVASMGILFETIRFLRGGFGNVAYFVLWLVAVVVSLSGVSFNDQGVITHSVNDLFGVSDIGASMQQAAHQAYPSRNLDLGIGYTVVNGPIQTFTWDGMRWTLDLILGRIAWLGTVPLIMLLSKLFFHRFDPARTGVRRGSASSFWRRLLKPLQGIQLPGLSISRSFSIRLPNSPTFIRTFLAELKLMLKGRAWWWYVVAIGLAIAGGLGAGESRQRGLLLAAAWIWPILIWSKLAVRERKFNTLSIVFSSPKPIRRQFAAMWLAGVVVAMLTGGGVGLALLLSGRFGSLLSWVIASFFIPSLAIALGTWAGSSKVFEALYVAWWYIGPVSGLPIADFVGVVAGDGRSTRLLLYAGLTFCLLLIGLAGRVRQVHGS